MDEAAVAEGWNLGDILDGIADALPPDKPQLIHGDRVVTWADFVRRTNNLARALRARGAQTGDKIAFYLRNHPAYLETLAAAFKGRLAHVNVNYRYVDEELEYIFDNSDATVVVYAREFADHIRALRARLPKVVAFVEVGDSEAGPEVEGALDYDALCETGDGTPLGIERSGQDLLLLYTGGTTGMPKGVMWAHDGLWRSLGAGASPLTRRGAPKTIAEHAENVRGAGGRLSLMPCCPLMHGTGLFMAIMAMANGRTIVTLQGHGFDARECFEAVQRWKVNSLVIVGDTFAKPMLRELDAHPGDYDLSSLLFVMSSGVMWSTEVKQGLLRHHPKLVLLDSLGASEGTGLGRSSTTADGTAETARFTLGENTKVFTEDGRELQPGDPEPGLLARGGAIPLGYYKDPEKTAKTFPTIGGVRYSMPGDWARVEADGTLTLLGRGSMCINTGGEKVYPEEVEEVLKRHADVEDALVVGVPDDQWGQRVTAVVQLKPGRSLEEDTLRAHAREHLAGYKVPKRIFARETLGRHSNGKADYALITAFAREQEGVPPG